jgi:hypothetical protein
MTTSSGPQGKYVTPLYRAVMLEVERRRLQLDISMERLSEVAGNADRSYSKALHAETASGRVAGWPTLQNIIDTLFPDGVDVVLRPRVGDQLTALSYRHKLRAAAAVHDRKMQRDLMRELGAKGGAARAAKLGPDRRKEIARAAGLARHKEAGRPSAAPATMESGSARS